jgi:L-fuconate dehydratase
MLYLQEEIVNATAFRYITDAITKEEALALLKEREASKKEREENVRKLGLVDLVVKYSFLVLTT